MKRRALPKIRGVVGLDLSLRSTGACFVPAGWEGDTRACAVGGWGRESDGTARDKARRMSEISAGVLAFVAQHVSPGGTVWAEEYAFAKGGQAHAAALRELGGAVKVKLYEELDVEVIPVVASQARKMLLGKLPRKDVKEYVLRNLERLRGEMPYWTDDQKDALVVANYGVGLLNLPGWAPISFEGA